MAGTGSDRVFIERSLRIAITTGAAILAVLALLWLLKSAITPLALALVIAYLLDPLIDFFEARRVPRAAAVVGLLALAGVGLFGTLAFLVPALQREVAALSHALPDYLERALATVGPWVTDRLGVRVPGTFSELAARVRSGEIALPLQPMRDLLGQVLAVSTGTLGALLGLLVVPVIAFYFLVDFDQLRRRGLDWVPLRFQDYVAEKARVIDGLVSGFLRGQLTVCAILAVLYALGFSLIGVDLALLIGVAAGMLAIVPYLGSAMAVVSASVMALLEFGLDHHVALVVGWYVLVQTLEGLVITPRIVGGSLGLHPVMVIVALLIGGDLLGFLGLLVAVPLAAVLKVFVAELLELYRASALYTDSPR